jgi:hypothetical protein
VRQRASWTPDEAEAQSLAPDPWLKHDPWLAKAYAIAVAIAFAVVGLAWLGSHYF